MEGVREKYFYSTKKAPLLSLEWYSYFTFILGFDSSHLDYTKPLEGFNLPKIYYKILLTQTNK